MQFDLSALETATLVFIGTLVFGAILAAFVLTHELYSAARLYRGSEVVNDQLIDGALWVVSDYDTELAPEMLDLYEFFDTTFERGGDL